MRLPCPINSFNSVTISSSPGSVNFAGNLSGNGSLIVSAGSTGNVTVSGAVNSNFSGPVVLNSGFLTVGSNNALGSGLLHLVGGTLQSSGSFSLINVFSVEGPAPIGGWNNLTLTSHATLQQRSSHSCTNQELTPL